MQARAAATDELLSNGSLSDLTAAPDSDLERQLSSGAIQADVERALQSMKSARAGHTATTRPQDAGPDAWLGIGQGPA